MFQYGHTSFLQGIEGSLYFWKNIKLLTTLSEMCTIIVNKLIYVSENGDHTTRYISRWRNIPGTVWSLLFYIMAHKYN